jgi:hypothetical protein
MPTGEPRERSLQEVRLLSPEQQEPYRAVYAWRIFTLTVFADTERLQEWRNAEKKPLVIRIRQNQWGHRIVGSKGGRHMMPFGGGFDSPTYMLEPLTEEEARAEIQRGTKLLSAAEFAEMLDR